MNEKKERCKISAQLEDHIPEARIGDFSGTMPPQRSARRENCLSASARVFSRQRSEDVHGRKISSARRDRDLQRPRYEVILAGSGGQGLVLAGVMLGEAAVREGRNVVQTQSYGIASRGGLSMAEVIVDREEIIYQQVQRPDIILALTEEALEKYAALANEGARIFYDTTLAKPRTNTNLTGHPFTKIASDLGNAAAVNILALGTLLAAIPVVKTESLAAVIRARFKGTALEMNLKALAAGGELA